MKFISNYQRLFCFLFFCSFISLNVVSQEEENIKDLFLEAESYFLFEEYKDALPLYQRILQVDPENYNINFKTGVCYLNDIYQVGKSISYLEKAVKGTSPNYRINNFRERMAPLEAYYYLGNAYRVNNMLDEAIETYSLFKQVLDPLVYDIELVEAQIEACEVAKAQQSRPMYFTSYNLGETINEQFDEINPVVSGDGSVLVFTRRLQFYDAVFYSVKENGVWTYPINLTPSFAVDGNTYVTGISFQGDEIFVYRSDNFDGNIYVSKRLNNQWSKLEKLNDNINTKYWESHASISDDGRTLYFTSNRRGGYGGLDIYKSERNDRGDWGPAINLGPVINSLYNEETPFVTDFGKTLYFSSMGHYNMGGYDIFYSTKLDNGQWSIPINVGYPLNTTNDDIFLAPSADGANAYYSKYNPEDSHGLADIYRMEVFTDLHPRKFILNGITRTEGDIKVDMTDYTVILTESGTGKIIDQDTLNSDGTYTLEVLSGVFQLQINERDATMAVERIIIMPDNPSDIIGHTSTIVPGSEVELPVAAITDSGELELPLIAAKVTSYHVTNDNTIPIELELDGNTKLQIETLVNRQLFKTENFNFEQRRFLYMFEPFQGTNLLRFKVTSEEGLSNTLEITVDYRPVAEEPAEELAVSEQLEPLSETDRYTGMASMAEGNLKKYLQILDFQNMQFGTVGALYNHLVATSAESGFTVEEVDALMIRYLAQKNMEFYVDELSSQASDSLAGAISRMYSERTEAYTPETFLNRLFENSEQSSYTATDLRYALYRVALADRNPLRLIDLLQSYTDNDLASFLDSLKQNPTAITGNTADVEYYINSAENGAYALEDIESALKKASYEMDVDFLYQSLLNISADSLHEAVNSLDIWEKHIRNSSELISHLLMNSEAKGYSREELIDNIELIRSDPYSLVEAFRDELAAQATGTLKIFLQEIDIRGLNIDTHGKLLDYLLEQSQYQEFNREMIYQLLIDVIDIDDVTEFIDLILQHADERIESAMYATNLELFSTPLEVVQYLLAASDQYAYTEEDLLNLLLKIFLERKPLTGDVPDEASWFSRLDKPELVSTLIIVNAIIIVIIIILIFRRKQRREHKST